LVFIFTSHFSLAMSQYLLTQEALITFPAPPNEALPV
jgi:hypothetical protein